MPKLYDTVTYELWFFKRKTVMCCKYWNESVDKAIYLYYRLNQVERYDSVKLHNNCVYVTKRCTNLNPSGARVRRHRNGRVQLCQS